MKRITLPSAWLAFGRRYKQWNAFAGEQSIHFDGLYQHYYPAVLGFLRFLVGSPEVAEDLTSLVFEKALLHLADVRTPDAVGPWLFRIARNCATDYFRRCKPTVSLEQLIAAEHLNDQQTASIEEDAIAREEQWHLLIHLSQLSEREREVIGLKFVANLHNREIARVLQIPEGTVGSLLYRSLRRLRLALDQEGGHDEIRS
ncbi:MAG TPA: RNA polymerase sigma factor [Ktedonobacteraceae bacterium]